jgi:cell division transport system permease protein
MIIPAVLAGPAAERRLLRGGNLKGPTPYVIAIMTFAMMIAAAAGLALANTAGLVAGAVEHRYVIQLPDGDDGKSAAAADAASRVEGVASVRPVPQAEMRQTLERWLGPIGAGSGLPVPGLVHVELSPGADRAAVARGIERAVPNGRLVAESAAVGPLLGSIRALQWLSVALVLLMAAATSAAVVLAARGALDTHRSTIEIMHGIGATDEQIAVLFQRRIAIDSLAGALAGGVIATLVLLVIGGRAASLSGDFAGGPPLGVSDLLLLGSMPLLAVALATLVARLAVLGALRKAP